MSLRHMNEFDRELFEIHAERFEMQRREIEAVEPEPAPVVIEQQPLWVTMTLAEIPF